MGATWLSAATGDSAFQDLTLLPSSIGKASDLLKLFR
jgi:hypothetical protein